jgi:hypothetical protein
MAKRQSATALAERPKALTPEVLPPVPKLTELVPPTDKKVLAEAVKFRRITSADQCARAVKALDWLCTRIKQIKNNDPLVRLKKLTKAAYDEVCNIEKQALNNPFDQLPGFVVLEKDVRNEIARFRTAEAKAREAAQSKLTTRLTKQLTRTGGVVEVEGEAGEQFAFEPDLTAGAITLQPLDTGNAGNRKYWHATLVDPKKPDIENVEAGIKALAAAVVAGAAPWDLLLLNGKKAEGLADLMNGQVNIPGLKFDYELRPVRK